MKIIAGRWRGRILQAPPGRDHRPTQGRVREAVFSLLGGAVEDTLVVDLFAGSGGLGLEALSRGAREVVFVEQSQAALTALRRNVASLGDRERSRIIAGDVFAFLSGRYGAVADVGLLFADPPYGDLAEQVATSLATTRALGWCTGALQVIEGPARREPWPPGPGWRRRSVRIYGDSQVVIDELERGDEPAD